jgi:radical SAM superfamily enzyme YgiQ (UPF0313 family)
MKLDCLLIHVPKLHNFYNLIGDYMYCMVMPMGLFAIADAVAREGYTTQILHLGVEYIDDPNFSLTAYLEKTNPRIVGLSLHWHYQSYDVIQTARKIKSCNPETFIVLGGFTASFFHTEIMEEYDCIDAIIRGDGEFPFRQLTERVLSNEGDLSGIANLTWRYANSIKVNPLKYMATGEDLNKLNFTNIKLLKNYELCRDISSYFWWINGLSKRTNLALSYPKYKIFYVSIARGCPVDCSYCGGGKSAQKIVNGRECLSIRSVDKVVESIKDALQYGYDTIHINYLPIPGYFEDLFKRLKTEGIRVKYIMECWTIPAKEVILKYKETFINHRFSIVISPETASERIRKAYKGFYFSNRDLFEFLGFAKKVGVSVSLFFIVGLPGETLDDIKTTRDFQKELTKRFGSQVSCQTETVELDPASPAYNEPERYGILKANSAFKDYFNTHGMRNNSSLSTSGMTYYIQTLSSVSKSRDKLNMSLFKKRMQRIVCREFCPFSNLISIKFKVNNNIFFRGIINLLSRAFCNVVLLYWKARFRTNQ